MTKAVTPEMIYEQYKREYAFIENAEERHSYVAGTDEAIEAGDEWLRNPENRLIIEALIKLHWNDLFTSDREVAALAFALSTFDLI